MIPDDLHDRVGPLSSLFRVAIAEGAASLVTTDSQRLRLVDVVVTASGHILVADHQRLSSCAPPGGTNSCPGAVFEVYPFNGAATVLSSGGHFSDVLGMDLYRGPSTTTPTHRTSWGRVKSIYR